MRYSVVFGVTLRLLVINISSSSPAINTAAYYQRRVTTCATVPVVHRRPCWQHLACCSINSGQLSQIQAQNRDFCLTHLHSTPPLGGSRRNIAIPFGAEKLEWLCYPVVKKNWRYVFIVFTQFTNVTDTQTDTAWRHRPRLCIASRGICLGV